MKCSVEKVLDDLISAPLGNFVIHIPTSKALRSLAIRDPGLALFGIAFLTLVDYLCNNNY